MSRFTVNTSALTAGALSGSTALAASLVAGVQQYGQAQREWHTFAQLRAALARSELMRLNAYRELNQAKAELADLRRQFAELSFCFTRERARARVKQWP